MVIIYVIFNNSLLVSNFGVVNDVAAKNMLFTYGANKVLLSLLERMRYDHVGHILYTNNYTTKQTSLITINKIIINGMQHIFE